MTTEISVPPLCDVFWDRSVRLIPSRYPPVQLFELIAPPADWEVLASIEGLTNDRLRQDRGDISLVPVAERISGPGATPIMAAFTHVGHASRFTSGTYGVYYASDSLEGALAEVIHHNERFLRRTNEPSTRVDLRAYLGTVAGPFHDVRGGYAELHHPTFYGDSQPFASDLRETGSNGILFNNVRLPGSTNIAAFKPKPLAATGRSPHTKQGPNVFLKWDGQRVTEFFRSDEDRWTGVNAA
jgi:hypothetical protein